MDERSKDKKAERNAVDVDESTCDVQFESPSTSVLRTSVLPDPSQEKVALVSQIVDVECSDNIPIDAAPHRGSIDSVAPDTTIDEVSVDSAASGSTENSEDETKQSPITDCETFHVKTDRMYAEVASLLASKVNDLADEPLRPLESETIPNFNTTLKRKTESLALIMSYGDDSSSSSDEDTEKEDGQHIDSIPRYQEISMSSGCSSADDGSSDDEQLDAGSIGNENHSESESDDDEEECSARSIAVAGEPGSTVGLSKAKAKALQQEMCLKDPLRLNLLPPIENLNISVPEESCMPIGKVYSIVDRLVVVESLPETPALMLDSVIFTRDGTPLGQIFDIFGHVKRPFYSIRFNSPEEIKSINVAIGKVVYCAPKTDHTKYIFTNQLLKEKGCDGSWEDDEEVPPEFQDFSDDDTELKATKKGKKKIKREPEVDSPARRRHLSFEQQMNRNNTLRNRAFKRGSQGEARNWDGGWHNYKKASSQFQQMPNVTTSDAPPPPARQIQSCAFSGAPPVNPMNLVIRPPCFNPVIDRPPVSFQPSPSPYHMTPPWTRFEPPPTPPPRGFRGYPNSPPSSSMNFPKFEPVQTPPPRNFQSYPKSPTVNNGAFQRFEPLQAPFSRFPSSPPSGQVFQGFSSSPRYGPPPTGFGPPGPRFSNPPPSPIPLQQSSAPTRFVNPTNCGPPLTVPPPPFSANLFPSYSPTSPNVNSPNNFQPRIPQLPFPSNNNHPPVFNRSPF